jgi:hypothetical protein
MPTNEENKLYIEQLEERIKNLENNNSVENVPASKFTDVNYFPTLKVDKIYGGFPIFTAVPTYVGRDGETVLYFNGTDYRIYCYLNSGWQKVGDVDFATDHGTLTGLDDNDHGAIYYTETEVNNLLASKLANVVEDTTPQLGGDLDTNDKAITSEGGLVKRHYTLTKTLDDNSTTSLFRVAITGSGTVSIETRYICAKSPSPSASVNGGMHISMVSTNNAGATSSGGTDAYTYELNGGTISVNWTDSTAIGEPPANTTWFTIQANQNNDANVSAIITAEITIISTLTTVTYAEL